MARPVGAGLAVAGSSVLLAFSIAPTSSVPAASTTGCAGEWPMYQQGPSHHAASLCADINPASVQRLRPAWFVPTPQPVTASPTVSGGQVYVGDESGLFSDIDATSGNVQWTFTVTPGVKNACGTTDSHSPSYGEITSSAAVAQVPGFADDDPTVFFGAGGSLFALDARTGACRWAADLDPANATSPLEVESSPVVFLTGRTPEVVVGSDANESPKQSAPGGVQALDARTGALLWKFEPENDGTSTTLAAPTLTNADGSADTVNLTDGCGDVWSSPALDPVVPGGTRNALGAAVAPGDGLVIATTGNCPQGTGEQPAALLDPAPQCTAASSALRAQVGAPQRQGMAAVDATTGCVVWRWSEPDNAYSNPSFPDGGDTDIGASPILTALPTGLGAAPGTVGATGTQPAVIDGSKSGYMYALSEATGAMVWSSQPAQPGQTGDALAGAVGGFIGSSALGNANGRAAVFGTSAIPAPFSGAGVQSTGPAGTPSASPDTSLFADPMRAASLHAVDAATGAVVWQAPVSMPSYSATTYAHGVVFAPSTTGFSVVAYDADTGAPLWAFPTAASMSSGAAVVGPSVFFGAGTDDAPSVPPQATGVWCFTLALS